MNILVLTTRFPYPPISGDRLRIFNIIKQLKLLGHKITLVSLFDNENDVKAAENNNDFYSKLIPIKFNKKIAYLNAAKATFTRTPFTVEYFYEKKMQKAIDEELKNDKYDLIFCHLIRTASYVEKYKNIRKIIDFTDAISYSYQRRLLLKRGGYDRFRIGIEFNKILNYEKKCLKTFDKTLIISQYDKDFLSKFADTNNIEIVTNGVDSEYFYYSGENQAYDNNKIVFMGSINYIPNVDAATFFGEKVFPKIKEKYRDAKFLIVGANPKEILFDMASKIAGIEITGKVKDVRDYIKEAAVSVCPVRIAAGVQNKILESMSMGIPVITTPEGAEGLNSSKNELLVAKNEKQMADYVIELMNNPQKRALLSKNGRDFIEKNYSWDIVGKKLSDILSDGKIKV